MSDTRPPTTRHPSYRGSDPFIFVCYSHREEELIEAEIAALAASGIRVKYDEGIEPGDAWQDEVADAIETCRAFLIFVSKHSVVSHDCRRELAFALAKKRPVVAVHLDDVDVPSAIRLQLGDRQAIIRSRLTEPEYRERLTSSMLKYQNGALDPDASEFDGYAPNESVKSRRRRGFLVATLLAALAITAVTLVAFKPQISVESQVVETPVKQEGIVVLPFENGSGRDEDAYLSEGFSDELRDQLSRVRGLRVVARPSSVAFRGDDESTSTIAKKLNAATIVEGNLQKAGDSLRITVRLIDARTDAQLWSESYDRKSSDLLAVQQEIALAAVKQILPQVDPTELPRPAWQASVTELMLLARNYQQKAVSPEDWDRVVSMYQQAAEANPESALVHARLAQALLYQGNDVESAEREARRALRIDPNLAEGHAVLGHLLWVQFRHGSSAELRRAIELNPNDAVAQYYYGEYLSFQSGETENMYKHLNRARDLDPMTLLYTATVAAHHAQRGEMRALRELVPIIKDRFPDAEVDLRFRVFSIRPVSSTRRSPGPWRQSDSTRGTKRSRATLPNGWRGSVSTPNRAGSSPNRRCGSCSGNVATTRSSSACRTWTSMMRMAIRSAISAFALQAIGRDSEAIPILQSIGLPNAALDDDLRRAALLHHLAILFGALHNVGETQRAQQLARWLHQLATGLDDDYNHEISAGWAGFWWKACALAVLGKRERALTEIETAAAAPNLAWLPLLRDAGCFRDLHDEPRYQKAIEALQARHDAIRERLPATLAKHGFTMDDL